MFNIFNWNNWDMQLQYKGFHNLFIIDYKIMLPNLQIYFFKIFELKI